MLPMLSESPCTQKNLAHYTDKKNRCILVAACNRIAVSGLTIMRLRLLLTLTIFATSDPNVFARTIIHVPSDQPTIQAGINAAQNGDWVVVSPGTYLENIDFLGKAITVKSANGPSHTTIQGNSGDVTVRFDTGEQANSVLKGFTLSGGGLPLTTGVLILNSSPTIFGNHITANHWCDGAGINISWGAPIVQKNVISGNFHDQCSGGIGGGGIAIVGGTNAQIIGNVISGNDGGNGFGGGGISVDAGGTPTIMNNIIRNNTIETSGGAIATFNGTDALIVQNLIYNNNASQGTGIYFLVPSGAHGPTLVNNTIIGGTGSTQGTAVFASGFDDQVQFYNNLLIGTSAQNAVYCDSTYDPVPPTFTNNDAFSRSGTGLLGTCAGQSSANGNISVDPLASKSGKLKAGSPAIDAGTNSAPNLPAKDLANKPRIVDGNNDGIATVDMGAYEYQP